MDKVYLLIEDCAFDCETSVLVEAYISLNAAKKEFENRIELLSEEYGIICNIKSQNEFVEETNELSYSCYPEGYYSETHYSLCIQETEVHN